MTDYSDVNRALWNRWTRIHQRSAFYDVDGFKAGKSSLMRIEREELGDVSGKSLLHLQCHFGLDTLSWARAGARVTGVDFAEEAIALARSLSEELSIPATFVCADLYELPEVLAERFDIVFTSYGVLPWLADIDRWARIAAHFLKPGGTFYLVEFHPFLNVLDDTGEQITYPYFGRAEPLSFDVEGSYADPDAAFAHPSYQWSHGLGGIVTALLAAGLTLEFLHEFPYSVYDCFPFLEADQPGRYVWRGRPGMVPVMFSIKATG
ncbi:MAG: class I SAM-dependent methyltransferase [Rhodothermales bacterium]